MSFLLSPRQPESNRPNDCVSTPLRWANGKFIFAVRRGVEVREAREWPRGGSRKSRASLSLSQELDVPKDKQWEKMYVSSNHSCSHRQPAYLYAGVNYVRNGKQGQAGRSLSFETGFVWAKMARVKHNSAWVLVLHDAIIVLVSLLKDSFDWTDRSHEDMSWGEVMGAMLKIKKSIKRCLSKWNRVWLE